MFKRIRNFVGVGRSKHGNQPEYIFLVLDDMFAVHLFSIVFPLGHF